MRLLFSTASFTYAGRSRPRFPIIVGDDMRFVQPMQNFLVWLLLDRGKALSPLTWEDYGRRMWDFAAFLNANKLAWDASAVAPGLSCLAMYRDWSLGELKLNPSTVNGRLRLVVSFYEWAYKQGYIERLPLAYFDAKVVPVHGLLAHARDSNSKALTSVVLVREWEVPPEFLSREQIRACVQALSGVGRRLLFDLMVRAGLRSCEARTFPLKYVFDPRTRQDCRPEQMIRVALDPVDMWIKFRKPRAVDVPYSLMCDLYAYTRYERNRVAVISDEPRTTLVLNDRGRPYTKGALIEAFKSLSDRVGFKVRPLQLRHSYAIHTLARLRSDAAYKGEPLLYLRDRMGHASVLTTAIYLRQLEQLAGGLALAIEDEFNRMFQIESENGA